jgi:hypothetical protein
MHPLNMAFMSTAVAYIHVRSEKAESECHFTKEFREIEKTVTLLLITLANNSSKETFRFHF